MRNGRPPTSHSMHSFLHQYTGSFKKPPLRRPHSVIGGTLGSFMAIPRNGSRLGEMRTFTHLRTGKEVSRRETEQTGNVSQLWHFHPAHTSATQQWASPNGGRVSGRGLRWNVALSRTNWFIPRQQVRSRRCGDDSELQQISSRGLRNSQRAMARFWTQVL